MKSILPQTTSFFLWFSRFIQLIITLKENQALMHQKWRNILSGASIFLSESRNIFELLSKFLDRENVVG